MSCTNKSCEIIAELSKEGDKDAVMKKAEQDMAGRETSISRLFLVGCPRSGTTLLQSLLAAHSQIVSFPESHFYTRIISSRFPLRQLGLASPRSRTRFLRFLDMIGHADMRHYLPLFAVSTRQYSRVFIAVLDAVARQQNKRVWLEKTPRHLDFVDDIRALVPESKFVHLVRNGEDVVASLYEVVNKHPGVWPSIPPGDLEGCIHRWVESIRLSQRYAGVPDHVIVRYEHLMEAPELVLKGLCEFIGVPFESAMLESYADNAASLVLPFETWKGAVTQAIGSNGERKFHRLFNESQRRHISAQIGQVDLAAL